VSWSAPSIVDPQAEASTLGSVDHSVVYKRGPGGSIADPNDETHEGIATFQVRLPENARLYINGTLTRTMGPIRRYVSPGLEAGTEYEYTLRAELPDNGGVKVKQQMVVATAGANAEVSFDFVSQGDDRGDRIADGSTEYAR